LTSRECSRRPYEQIFRQGPKPHGHFPAAGGLWSKAMPAQELELSVAKLTIAQVYLNYPPLAASRMAPAITEQIL
jgi:hypothetical protein